jgi:hypothetical protein
MQQLSREGNSRSITERCSLAATHAEAYKLEKEENHEFKKHCYSYLGLEHFSLYLMDYGAPIAGAHSYKRDLKNLDFPLLDTGHFALEEDGDVIAQHICEFLA